MHDAKAHGHFAPVRWLRSAHVQTLGASLALWSPPRAFGEVAARGESLRFPLGTTREDGALHAEAWWQPADAGACTTDRRARFIDTWAMKQVTRFFTRVTR